MRIICYKSPTDYITHDFPKEELLEVNSKYMVKRLTMDKGHRCSLQYHDFKLETIYVLEGKLKIYFGAPRK